MLEIGLGGATVDNVTDAALTGVAKARTGDVAAVAITRAAATLPAIAAALGTAIAARKRLASSDRQLDCVVGGGRARDGDGDAGRVERYPTEVRATRCEHEQHRPVPQVEAVRDRADPDERRERKERADRAPRLHGGGDHDRHADGEEEEAAAVHAELVVADGRVRRCHGEQGHPTDPRDHAGLSARHTESPALQEHREQGADEKRVHARVAAEVGAGRVGIGEPRHQHC